MFSPNSRNYLWCSAAEPGTGMRRSKVIVA